jgi:hypothetical protein
LQQLVLAAAVAENKNPLYGYEAAVVGPMGDRLVLRGGKAWAMM